MTKRKPLIYGVPWLKPVLQKLRIFDLHQAPNLRGPAATIYSSDPSASVQLIQGEIIDESKPPRCDHWSKGDRCTFMKDAKTKGPFKCDGFDTPCPGYRERDE